MSNPQHEPTMEEILASIRKIISEDATEAQPEPAKADAAPKLEAVAPAPVAAAAPAPVAEPVDDVLDLTDEVQDEPAPHDDIVFQHVDETPAAPQPTPEPVREPEPVRMEAPEPAPQPDADHSGLFRDRARSAFDDALDRIETETAKPVAAVAPAGPLPSAAGPSLADVVDQAIRKAFDPVLREWLDKNSSDLLARVEPVISELLEKHLPEMLATAVREEMARAKARR